MILGSPHLSLAPPLLLLPLTLLSLLLLLLSPVSYPIHFTPFFSLQPPLLTLLFPIFLFILFSLLLAFSSPYLFHFSSHPSTNSSPPFLSLSPIFLPPRLLTPPFVVHSFLFPFSLLSLSTLTPLLLPINFLPFCGLPSLHTRPPSSSHEPVIGLQEVTDVLACVPDGKAEGALSR